MEKSEKVETYYATEHHFQSGIQQLRELALKTNLEETFKWMFPTYTLNQKNVLSICRFKNHFGIWFHNGVFLRDEKGVLQNAQEGKTQAMRHWKFDQNEDIDETAVLGYIREAIENEKKGMRLIPKKKSAPKVILPEELADALSQSQKHQEAFKKLSPYKQKDYAEHIASAKQAKTKQTRLEKILPMILNGVGLNDRYRK